MNINNIVCKCRRITITNILNRIRMRISNRIRHKLLNQYEMIDADADKLLCAFSDIPPQNMANFVFYDENEHCADKTHRLFLWYFFLGKIISNKPKNNFSVNGINITDKYKESKGCISIDTQKHNKNNWAYFLYDIPNCSSYRMSMKIRVEAVFHEVQWSVCNESVYERIKLRVVDNKRMDFDVVTGGFFYDRLYSVPFSFNIDQTYSVDIVVDKSANLFSVIVDDRCIICVKGKHKNMKMGKFGIILYDFNDKRIKAQYNDLRLYAKELTTEKCITICKSTDLIGGGDTESL